MAINVHDKNAEFLARPPNNHEAREERAYCKCVAAEAGVGKTQGERKSQEGGRVDGLPSFVHYNHSTVKKKPYILCLRRVTTVH